MEENDSKTQASSKVEINIPDISNVEIKTHKSNNKLPDFIKLLCSAQILLIVFVLFIVCCSCIQCSSCCSCKSVDFSGFNFNPSDNNTFTAIILALITLCATLSTLIPYMLGRAITSKQIREEAKLLVDEVFQMTKGKINNLIDQIADIQITQSLLKSQIEGVKGKVDEYQEQVEETKNYLERKIKENYDETIKKLHWEEGHTARMIAYLLKYKQTKDLSDDNKTKEQREIEEICWSIGWSAKAMIRYFKISGEGFHKQEFLDNCIKYIIETKSFINKLDVKDKEGDGHDKLLRAFIDLYDTFRFFEWHLKNDMIRKKLKYGVKDDEKDVQGILKLIYEKFVKDEPGTEYKRIKEIQEAIKDKAKWIEYLPNMDKNASGEEENAQKEKALEEAHNWLIKEGICDDKWMPRT